MGMWYFDSRIVADEGRLADLISAGVPAMREEVSFVEETAKKQQGYIILKPPSETPRSRSAAR